MKLDWYDNWRTKQPLLFTISKWLMVFIAYYLLVILPLEYMNANLQSEIQDKQKQAEWMGKAGQQIRRLQQIVPGEKGKSQMQIFMVVNQTITAQGWNILVTDLRQIDVNRVQVNFKSISFTDLLAWLEKLYTQHVIYVTEATLNKTQIGVVDANLELMQ